MGREEDIEPVHVGESIVLSCELSARPGSPGRLRRMTGELLECEGVDADQVDDVRLAISEAASNVVTHGYPDSEPGQIGFLAMMAGSELIVSVSDSGQGRRAGTDSGGLGLGLGTIREVADDVIVEDRVGGGTAVQMRFDLRFCPESRVPRRT